MHYYCEYQIRNKSKPKKSKKSKKSKKNKKLKGGL